VTDKTATDAQRSGFAQRVLRLVEVCESRRAFARLIGQKSDRTVMLWEEGSVPFHDTLERIAERTGVTLEWLRDGTGDERKELQKFQEKFRNNPDAESGSGARIAEGSGEYLIPDMTTLPPPTGAERAMELAAKKLEPSEMANLIESVLNDTSMHYADRTAMAQRLTVTLFQKLRGERERTAPPGRS
jgi:transcriptional regulator with XRE-family HTH domain